MTLNEYQKQAMTTCMESCANIPYMLFNLQGEVGELSSKIAKLIRKQPIARTTQAQAMRWLRENRSLHIEIDAYKRYGKPMYGWRVVSITEDFLISASDVMTTYEKAAEAGIQDACKYIIKNKETRE